MSFPTRAVPRRGHGTSVCPGRASPLEHYNPPSFYQTASPGNFQAARKGLHGDYLGRWCSPAAAECPPVPLCPSVRLSAGGEAGRAGPAFGAGGGKERREGEREGRERREGRRGSAPPAPLLTPTAPRPAQRRRGPGGGSQRPVGRGRWARGGLRDGGVRRGEEGG